MPIFSLYLPFDNMRTNISKTTFLIDALLEEGELLEYQLRHLKWVLVRKTFAIGFKPATNYNLLGKETMIIRSLKINKYIS